MIDKAAVRMPDDIITHLQSLTDRANAALTKFAADDEEDPKKKKSSVAGTAAKVGAAGYGAAAVHGGVMKKYSGAEPSAVRGVMAGPDGKPVKYAADHSLMPPARASVKDTYRAAGRDVAGKASSAVSAVKGAANTVAAKAAPAVGAVKKAVSGFGKWLATRFSEPDPVLAGIITLGAQCDEALTKFSKKAKAA